MINKLRRLLYRTASLLGDVNAVLKGKIVQRIMRKFAFRKVFSFLNKLMK